VRILAHYYTGNDYFLYNPKPAKIKRLDIKDNMTVKQPQSWLGKKLPALWRSKLINKDMLNDKIDIYHGLSGELPFGIDKIPVKSVVTIHDLIFIHFPELYKPLDRKIYTAKFKYAAQKSDKIVAISEQTKNDIIKFFEIPAEKIQVIYQGCHQAFKDNYTVEELQAVQEKYDLPDNFILNVGTLEARKNALSIVKAIKNTHYQLVLVGRQTEYTQKIHRYIEENGLQNQVRFLEGLDLKELAILYRLADIFIYPSLYEGFGIPTIEALFSKTPVITNKNGVFPEAAGPDAFYLENPENPVEIRRLIEQIYTNPDAGRIEKSYEFVRNKFSDDKIAKQYMEVYQKLVNK
jgi:glycosyltransferase involved in cell wall biosynthesis